MKKKYNKTANPKKFNLKEENLRKGIAIVEEHPLFGNLDIDYNICGNKELGKETAAIVNRQGAIYLNKDLLLPASQWAYTIAHCELHLSFGHFDYDKLPGYEKVLENGEASWIASFDKKVWNDACDIYITKFLMDIKFGSSACPDPTIEFPLHLTDERRIYEYLTDDNNDNLYSHYGVANGMDMAGLENPVIYAMNAVNQDMENFARALAWSVSHTVGTAGGHKMLDFNAKITPSLEAAQWFINHYPLFGALASAFTIIEDVKICRQHEIQIAAIDVSTAEIFINPTAKLNKEETKFVMAHEFLHAGLQHHERRQGRNAYLWNIACDYVINGWLYDMEIGQMPDNGLLFDEALKNRSAESIYDMILRELRKYSKLDTFRGYGKGDIIDSGSRKSDLPGKTVKKGITLDEFYKNALAQGLEYHQNSGRGYIPAGLIEQIRALAMPPIPWDVELANWFETYFPPIEPKRNYSKPSRRQASTPDIPRAKYEKKEYLTAGRTFGVIIDTSCSMSTKMIGMALGSIASFSAAKDIPYARVVFCDAAAYDAGYLAPEDISGNVNVKGRGGTILQPGINLLEHASDFPKNGPILIITDGAIENSLEIHRTHAFLLPFGCSLPFKPRGDVFRFSSENSRN